MGLYGVWNIQRIRGKIVMNSDERAQAIIKGFKKLTLEQMEQMRTTKTMEKNYHSIMGVNKGERGTL